ncbi:MAG TPA: hypothetical protein VNV85_05965, partial [Puia sp.]|nr:hypothetical protein [Puia sp.]
MRSNLTRAAATISCIIFFPALLLAQSLKEDSVFIINNYTKIEKMIPVRDGVRLFTAIYMPKDNSEKHPF